MVCDFHYSLGMQHPRISCRKAYAVSNLTSSDWIIAGTQIVQVVMTIGLVYYAGVTINEARKDRKKDTIERRLERIYFPMFDILERARGTVGSQSRPG